MAGEKSLNAKLRTEDFGSAGARRVLRSGNIPAVVYGKNEPIHVTINAREFLATKGTFTGTTLISLKVEGGGVHRVFVKALQENLLKGIVQHIDFYEVTAGQALRAKVRIELEGNPIGVRNGGVLDQILHEVEIECLPKDLPETIVADVSALDIDDVFRVEMLVLPNGVKVLDNPDSTIASVKIVKEETEETAESAEAEETSESKSEEKQ